MDRQLIIVIGLPGSGKTHLCREISSLDSSRQIVDDFIGSFYNGNITRLLSSECKLCINDPRLCLKNVFKRFIKIFEQHIGQDNIYLILFENNPEQCKFNVQNRNDNRKGILEIVDQYSQRYDIATYSKYDYEIRTVFK
ncbi:hypothetical protein [Acanthamoeba polyphaga mimivirus]|nr:hypothetical protein [Acanthamoeba castellanii mamavirus]UMZ08205.1 hypothetical protein [Acanthamoeba polyphaga mimivirus]